MAELEFLFNYHDHLPAESQQGLEDLLVTFNRLIHRFKLAGGTSELVLSTAGVRVIVAKACCTLLDGDLSDEILDVICDLCLFVPHDDAGDAASAHLNLEERIDGARGTADDLALLMIRHFTCLETEGQTLLPAAILFILQRGPDHIEFHAALLHRGFTEVLTHALSLVAVTDGTNPILGDGITVFAAIMIMPLGFPRLGVTLSRGLLRLIVLWARRHWSERELSSADAI
ncbi:hypothetical protein FB451DRAFT_1402046 [Mycena latifolia]|nr:hypothetical protein FB451DRAFT_1402046 [Mycena latifolia]